MKNRVTRQVMMEQFLKQITVHTEIEEIPLADAFERIVTEDLYAKYTLPVVQSAAKDGIAVHYRDFEKGMPDTSQWMLGKQFVFADTGDDFPREFDMIIQIERVSFNEKGTPQIQPNIVVEKNKFIRAAGSEILAGDLLICAGTKITEMHLIALATGGIHTVPVYKKPNVSLLLTGSELISHCEIPERGQNIESNSFMVRACCTKWGSNLLSTRLIKDDYNEISKAIDQAAVQSDLVLINGGSSKGSEDYTVKIVQEKSTYFRHGVLARPGYPVATAMIQDTPVIILPGPPLATFLALEWCVNPVISHMLQTPAQKRHEISVTLAKDLKKDAPVEQLVMLQLVRNESGWLAYPLSGGTRISDLFRKCNAILTIPLESNGYLARESVSVQLINAWETYHTHTEELR